MSIRRSSLCVIVSALLHAPVPAAQPQVTPPPPSTAPADDPTRQIEASIERVAPLVAKALGVDSVPDVSVRLATREELTEAVLRDTLASMEGLLPPGVDIDVTRQTEQVEESLSLLALVAIYSHAEGAMLVSPELVEVAQDQARQAGLDPGDALDQLIAHELVHAVQDAEVGLLKVQRAAFAKVIEQNRLEADFLKSAVVEGQATLVQLRIAEEIGGEPLRAWVRKRLPGDGNVLSQHARAYAFGLCYCESVAREEGMAGVWRRLSDPPWSIDELVRVSGQRADAIERAFEGFERDIGPGEWTPLRRDGLEQTLGAGIGLLSEDNKAMLRDGLVGASVVGRMETPTPDRSSARALVISMLEYKSDDQANAALAPLIELVRLQAMRFTFNPDGTRAKPEQRSVRLTDGQLAYFAQQTMAQGGKGTDFGLLAWGVSGRRLLIINGVGVPGAANEVHPLLRLISKRVKAIDEREASP